MSRIDLLKANFLSKIIVQHTFYIDFGSKNTRVAVDGNIILNQPTQVLYQDQPAQPIKQRRIIDESLAATFLQPCFDTVTKTWEHRPAASKSTHRLEKVRANLYYGYPGSASPVDQQIYLQVFSNSNFFQIEGVASPLAIFSYLQQRFQLNEIAILDIGYQVTELTLFFAGQLVQTFKITLASDDYLQTIKQTCLNNYHVLLRDSDALRILTELVTLDQPPNTINNKLMTVRGKSIDDQLISTIHLKAQDFYSPLLELTERLLDETRLCLADCPQQKIVSIMDKGLYITGGGSQIKGLKNLMQLALKSQIIMSDEPFLDVVKGLYAHGQKSE